MRSSQSLLAVVLCLMAAPWAMAKTPAALPTCVPPPPPKPVQGCEYKEIDVNKYGRQPFRTVPSEFAKNGHLTTTLNVQYTDPAKTKIAGCPVTLRSYNGQLVGPTLRIKPGDTLDIQLRNVLPRETPQQIADQANQQICQAHLETRPHPYNTTNLHTHGLHVSPVGNSDNVLLAISPQTSFQYEIRVPANHPPGTYWYHAHSHGSTAIQVGSGLAGALIIEDDERKLPPALREATKREQVFLIQTLLYDNTGRVDDITAFFPDSPTTQKLCAAGKPGCTWDHSKRRTTLNGQIVPVIKMRPGEVQRWRFIDGAFRESLTLQLEGHALHEIALDGLYLGRVDTWGPTQSIELQPGYRSDVLIKASTKPGTYRLIDTASTAERSIRGAAEPQDVLAELIIEGEPMDMALPTSAEMAPLAPFPGVNLKDQAVGVQTAVYKLAQDLAPTGTRNYFQINGHAFHPSRIRYLKLGATDVWTVSTVGDSDAVPADKRIPPLPHVFHIHVNPFQVLRKNPAGQDEMVWRDTVLIPAGQTVNLYTQYLDYIGQFVMHCHILDHEDLGMMETVEVVGDQPLSSHGAHH